MFLQETLGKLVTATQNRVVMIWDIRSMSQFLVTKRQTECTNDRSPG
ncbi:unnamed protein product [Nippostrongylus brasiliensis]|uniref:WD_REPEATS_REGION domain-containing protein n=1 Tax=Nippostrongylus brasiliensis TaxID=27835 RepID=A0A0N4XSP7_NIPBR|nr:unnamed protein product [Nippostrongylus brasiliensis]